LQVIPGPKNLKWLEFCKDILYPIISGYYYSSLYLHRIQQENICISESTFVTSVQDYIRRQLVLGMESREEILGAGHLKNSIQLWLAWKILDCTKHLDTAAYWIHDDHQFQPKTIHNLVKHMSSFKVIPGPKNLKWLEFCKDILYPIISGYYYSSLYLHRIQQENICISESTFVTSVQDYIRRQLVLGMESREEILGAGHLKNSIQLWLAWKILDCTKHLDTAAYWIHDDHQFQPKTIHNLVKHMSSFKKNKARKALHHNRVVEARKIGRKQEHRRRREREQLGLAPQRITRDAYVQKLEQAPEGPCICIDFSFSAQMTVKAQLGRLKLEYRAESPADIFQCDSLVFLSPDAEAPLECLDSSQVYVIGGLVDETKVKTNAEETSADELPVNETDGSVDFPPDILLIVVVE
ncbi:unnamed protein product, partial [Darwinula stevensoni]